MKVDVKLDNLHNLECFRKILEKYRDFKSFYRELKINSVLGNKSQFDINDINPPLIGGFEADNSSFASLSLEDWSFSVNSISFIVDSDLNVIEISLDINTLETTNGQLLHNLIEFEHDIDFRVKIMSHSNYYEVTGFQVCSDSKLSA